MLLCDGRFPSGSYAYSAGMEHSVSWGDVADIATVREHLAGRLSTTGIMAAQVVAAASKLAAAPAPQRAAGLDALDTAVDARLAPAAARDTSREQARRWLRAASATWPEALRTAGDLLAGRHFWVVLGFATAALGIEPQDAAWAAIYDLASTPLWAASRLLGLDPFESAHVLAGALAHIAVEIHAVAREAVLAAEPLGNGIAGTEWISSIVAPLSDLAAQAHLEREERLFAS
jgi:urease accessory protein